MGRLALVETLREGIIEGLIPKQVDGRGRPLTPGELSRLRAGASGTFLGPRDVERYRERHAGILHAARWQEGLTGVGTQATDPLESFEGLDLGDLNKVGQTEAMPTLNSAHVHGLLLNAFDGAPITRLRRYGVTEDVAQKDEEPTGTESFVFIEGTSLAEARRVIKVPIVQPVDKIAAEETVLVQNIFSLLAPGQILPINGTWLPDESISTGGVFMYTMPKVEKHPEFDTAMEESLIGDPSHLLGLIRKPFLGVLEKFRKHEIPFEIDPPQRNFITTQTGTEVFIEQPWVEAQDVINPWTKIAMWAALIHSITPGREGEWSVEQMSRMQKRLDALNREKAIAPKATIFPSSTK